MYVYRMDAETIRLIITAGAAVIAGLGGAALTAIINRKNTKDTLASARLSNEEQSQRTLEREHATWLRDKKQEAYIDFLTLAESMIHQLNQKPDEEDPEFPTAELSVMRGRIKALGTPEVRRIAREIDTGMSRVQFAQMWNAHSMASMERHREEHAKDDSTDPEARKVHQKMLDADRASIADSTQALYGGLTALSHLVIQYVVAIRKDLGTTTPDDEAFDDENRRLSDQAHEDGEELVVRLG